VYLVKRRAPYRPAPNVADYDDERARFSWSVERAKLETRGGLNIADAAIDRHASGPLASKVAIRWRGRTGKRGELTFADLAAETSRFANALVGLGILEREVVFTLCGRIPQLDIAVFGALKRGCVVCPVFSTSAPEPIITRVNAAHGRVLVTTASLYRRRVAVIRDRMPSLSCVIVIDDEPELEADIPDTLRWNATVDVASPEFTIAHTAPDAPALLHFTCGTVGPPKGVVHTHEAVVAVAASARAVLDLHDEDIYWCTADPGWITATAYGMIAPLVLGVTSIVDEGGFLATRWCATLEEENVSVWYTTPIAIRRMMRVGTDLPGRYNLAALRFIASTGEPLDREAVLWAERAFGVPVCDNWWQTETGAIAIGNHACMTVRPGSMGKPLAGIEAGIVEVVGGKVSPKPDGVVGELALRAGWPSMFREYLHDAERYERSFVDGWYLTGDLARRDRDGYFWFVGRREDMIESAGRQISPFEVESALVGHPAVAQAAAIGMRDPVAGEVVKAFVTLRTDYQPDKAMHDDLLAFGVRLLGPAVAPREIVLVRELPRTRTGKILRRLLRLHERGLPEGDTSILDNLS
jgi:acetyl-CoA synthetase